MLSLKFNILSHNSVPSGKIWNIPSQTGVVLSRWSFWVQQPCVVLKIEHFVPYSVYLNIICFMSTEAIYFIFQGFILVALNDNLECTVFM